MKSWAGPTQRLLRRAEPDDSDDDPVADSDGRVNAHQDFWRFGPTGTGDRCRRRSRVRQAREECLRAVVTDAAAEATSAAAISRRRESRSSFMRTRRCPGSTRPRTTLRSGARSPGGTAAAATR